MTRDFSLGSFIGGFMLGALLVGAWLLGSNSLLSSMSPVSAIPPAPANAKEVQEKSGAVSVADQPAGDRVVVESVTVPPPGVWIAVREVNGSDLGNVLGALRVSGPRSDVTIPLLRATEPGLSYAVELYRDDTGDFDFARNSVYVDFSTGAPVIALFTTTN
jgi:hypothetical protein